MPAATVLRPKHVIQFDPANKQHRAAFAHFLTQGRWPENAPRFEVEEPYTSAVTTCEGKLVHYALRAEMKELATTAAAAA